jgi:3-oxoacyl-[acyl-carrier-protein] synthase-1
MRRVVVTGIGIVSSIGSDAETVTASLKNATSGITHSEEQTEHGFRSRVAGRPVVDIDAHVPKRARRFMGDGAAWNYIAMQQAIDDSGLGEGEVSHVRTGLVMGSGGPSTVDQVRAADIVREKGAPKRIGPFAVPRCMSSTNSATLATPFKIKGVNYSISSACSTSAHCIGHGAELIQFGKQDIVFAGGGEDLHWSLTCLFDAMAALSSNFNDTPAVASRAYDENRDGFVIGGGAGTVVLEEYERAKARGATIYGELIGYGANSDGFDMVAPSGEGAVRCMELAMSTIGDRKVSYINTHGTSTPVGDEREMQAMRDTFGAGNIPDLSSTKSLTGHSLGATGVQEAIYCLLMMKHGFKTKSAHIETLDPAFADIPILRERKDEDVDVTMSNSFGFGGTNATLVFGKV